jgi:hypothetical protein
MIDRVTASAPPLGLRGQRPRVESNPSEWGRAERSGSRSVRSSGQAMAPGRDLEVGSIADIAVLRRFWPAAVTAYPTTSGFVRCMSVKGAYASTSE